MRSNQRHRGWNLPLSKNILLTAIGCAAVLAAGVAHAGTLDPQLEMVRSWATHNDANPTEGVSRAANEGEILLPTQLDRATAESRLGVLIRGSVSRSELEALGVSVGTQAGTITTAIAPLGVIDRIASLAGVEQVQLSNMLRPQTDVSMHEINADILWGSEPPNFSGLSGDRVVVGIVDTGVDIDHADFRTSSNKTRIKYAWDQSWSGTPPPGFNYGVQYTESQINAGQASSMRDFDGHGSHTAGIAAGNGRATGQGLPNYRYVGVAPEAYLVVVKTNFTENGIIDGVNFVFQKAASLGRPAVVNLAVGTHEGAHDGTSFLDEAISALAGPGKIICAAAGNYGLEQVHASVNLGTNQTSTVSMVIPPYNETTLSPENVVLEGWHPGNASFRVRLTSPSGYSTGWIEPGNSSGSMTNNDGTMILDNATTSNRLGAKQIMIGIWRNNQTSPHPAEGTWQITMTRKSGTSSGVCDWWVSSWFLSSINEPHFPNHDPSMTITSPATGDDVISTGAYSTKVQWTNGNGQTSSYFGTPLSVVADFSSQGPRRDGRAAPDVVAPGYGVMAALSSDANASYVFRDQDLVHRIDKGTSQASAHTAGAVALLLEDDGGLTPDEVRTLLRVRAATDSYTGSTPNPEYGYGKLDLIESSTAVPEVVLPSRFAFAEPMPNPSFNSTRFRFALSAADVATGGALKLEIFDAQGRRVRALPGAWIEGEQILQWDGRNAQGQRAPSGVYFARLVVGELATVRKVIRAATE